MKASLREVVVRNLGLKVISIVVALGLWFIVLGSRVVEVSKEVPLEVLTADDVVSVNEIPNRIVFRLAGPKAFMRAILNRIEEPIRVNFQAHKPGSATYRFFNDNIRLPLGVKVVSIHPSSITAKLEKVKYAVVPARTELSGAPQEGYEVKKVVITPSEIRIKGAESVIHGIREVVALPVDVTGKTQSFEVPATFPWDNLRIRPTGGLPRIQVVVAPRSANFKIKNVQVRVLSDVKVQLKPSSVEIHVRSSQDTLQALDQSQIYVEIDARRMKKGQHEVVPRVIKPKEISVVRVKPAKLHLTVME